MAWEEELDASSDDEFVPAVFARSLDEAEELRQLLEDHGIEAVLGDEAEPSSPPADPDTTLGAIAHGVAVLVPEMYLDEASEIIADREDADEFEPDDEEEDEKEDDDEFALGDEDEEDGFFQIEEEDDESHGDKKDEYLDKDEDEEEGGENDDL